MSQPRHTADSITDDALDALYANASKGWRRGDEWKAKHNDVLRIVSAWVCESNNSGGIDADDLTWRLEQAGHQLPEEGA